MNTHTRFKAEDSGSSFISRFLDIATIALAMYCNLKLQEQVTTLNYIFLLTTVLVAYLYTAESVKLYRSLRIYSMTNTLWLVLFSLFIAFSAMLVVVFTLKITADFSRLVLGGWFVMSLSVLCLWRFLGRQLKNTLHKKGISTKRVAIVGCTPNALQLRDEIKQRPEMGLVFAGIYDDRTPERLRNCRKDLIGRIEDAVDAARDGDIDILYLTLPMSADKRIAEIIQQLGDTTVDVHLVPDFLLYNLMHARFGRIGKVETISVFESPYFGARDWLKRSFDIAFSFVALMFLALPMLAIAIAIKLTSRGPVFFKQDRYGLDGKAIKVFKFRSMTVQENGAKVVQATKGDARITPLGAFLRRTSLDELPQFINVLLGDMSVVGPRPHAVAHNEEYRKLVAFYMLRHKVKPGITGWAQINGWRGETDTLEKMEKRVEFDLAYIKNWSLWLDIKIVFLTFFRGFTGKNAY